MIEEPQEWYHLIRARLSAAHFPKYSWQGANYYQNNLNVLTSDEYKRLTESNWTEYDREEATQRQQAMERYFREEWIR